MLTTEGKNHIRRYLAGWNSSIAQALAFGVGNRAETLTDSRLHLESGRVPITFVTYDFATNKLIFKSAIPEEYAGKIYEIGLYSLEVDPNEAPSIFISTFDSATESWINPTTLAAAPFASTATRLGADSLVHAPAASNTIVSALENTQLDLSGFSGSDSFTFAYACADNNTNQIIFRFMTDASNSYTFPMGVQTSGYKIVEVNKSAATVTGAPSWSNITEIRVETTAKSTGATSVEYDAIRLEDKDSTNLDYVLVARKVLPAPSTKLDGQPMDIEFSLDVSLP